MAKKYRIGVIGHTGRGNFGHGLDVVWHEVPGCEIVAVADGNAEALAASVKRTKAPKGFSDYRKLLDETKPDIVSVAPRWLDQHRDMVVAAAERGVHIYMEKPMCRDLQEADAMVAACEKYKVKLAISFQTRYSPKLQVVHDLIDAGKIGELVELRGRGKEDSRRGGGEDLWVLGAHIMNLMHHFGGEPNWCFAEVLEGGERITKKHVKPGNEGIGPLAGDRISAMYGMDHGVSAYFGTRRASAPRHAGRFALQIFGSQGIIEITIGHLSPMHLLRDPYWSPGRSGQKWLPITTAGLNKPEPLKDGGLHAGNVLLCKDLISAIEDDRQPEASVYEARTSVEMIAAVFESHRLNAPASFPLKNRKNPLLMLE